MATQPASTTYSTPGPSERLAALPTLAPGLTIATLRRVWNATHEDFRDQRATLVESRICMHRGGQPSFVKLVDLTLEEVEGILGAVTPKYVVRWYAEGKGVQVTTFINERDAREFAAGKKLHAQPAQVRPL